MDLTTSPSTDGETRGVEDPSTRVEIDLSDETDRWRYTCPRGHRNWDRTNNHVWCRACSRAAEHDEAVSPEYYELLDQKTDERVPWSAIRVVG